MCSHNSKPHARSSDCCCWLHLTVVGPTPGVTIVVLGSDVMQDCLLQCSHACRVKRATACQAVYARNVKAVPARGCQALEHQPIKEDLPKLIECTEFTKAFRMYSLTVTVLLRFTAQCFPDQDLHHACHAAPLKHALILDPAYHVRGAHHPPSRHAGLTAQRHPAADAVDDAVMTGAVVVTTEPPAGVAAAAEAAGRHAGQS